jgi:hypothetical protein
MFVWQTRGSIDEFMDEDNRSAIAYRRRVASTSRGGACGESRLDGEQDSAGVFSLDKAWGHPRQSRHAAPATTACAGRARDGVAAGAACVWQMHLQIVGGSWRSRRAARGLR